jgi:heme o synthase
VVWRSVVDCIGTKVSLTGEEAGSVAAATDRLEERLPLSHEQVCAPYSDTAPDMTNINVTSERSNAGPECSDAAGTPFRWRDFLALTKPKVSLSIVFTAIAGMVLAAHGAVPLTPLVFGSLGIMLASASAAAFNHVLDRRLDEKMTRTRRRPLPSKQMRTGSAVAFAITLGVISMLVLLPTVGLLTAALTLCSLIGYAVVYTVWLKRMTPQNIVIGGAAGAFPPVIGWAAVSNGIDLHAWVLFLIIFLWTPPHFWSLAIARRDEYAKAGIPMLPVTHGVPHTRLQIAIYTAGLSISTLLPYITGMSGRVYLAVAILLDARLLHYVLQLYQGKRTDMPMRTFRFSITYLLLLFSALIADQFIRV